MPSDSRGNKIHSLNATLLFETFDFDHSGDINVQDFIEHLKRVGIEKGLTTNPEGSQIKRAVERLISEVASGREFISADEFLNLLYEYMDQE